MKIYTKTGDSGQTGLFGGKRVEKNNRRIEAYGTIDELNSIVGLVLCEKVESKTKTVLTSIQNSLFIIGSELATPSDVKSSAIQSISENEIQNIEKYIDDLDDELTPLKNFILPGGCKSAAILHFARTVCRRAERRIVDINSNEEVNSNIIKYINRVSDLLFVLARYENQKKSTSEIEWKPRG